PLDPSLLPYTALFRSTPSEAQHAWEAYFHEIVKPLAGTQHISIVLVPWANSPKQWESIARKLAERCQAYLPQKTVSIQVAEDALDRKSTRLNSSHVKI